MKNKKGLLLLTFIMFGIFLTLNSVSAASDIDMLQPAEAVNYNDNLIVDGFGEFNALKVGKQGVGGVTFFNGTIVNNTTDNGADNPVRFGDNVSIDGVIYAGKHKGTSDIALKIADSIIPAMDNINDLGESGKQWNDVFYKGTLTGNVANLNTLTVGGGYENTGVTIDTDGDINQSVTQYGAIKAQVFVKEDGDCITYAADYNWTFDNSAVVCEKTALGKYTLTFGFTANNRLAQVTTVGDQARFATVSPNLLQPKEYLIYTFTSSTGTPNDTNFVFTLF